MKLKNVSLEDAKLYLKKLAEQLENKTPEQQMMKYLVENGVEKFATPYNVSWEVTAACNLRCKHCCFAGQEYNPQKDISHEDAINFVQQLLAGDVVKVMLTGGEPLLRTDLFDIIELLKTKNVAIELTSNAILINDENAKKLGQLLNPLSDYVQVSLDGADIEIHENTRGKGSFEKTIAGIKLLIQNGVKVTINCVVTTVNMHQMCELYDLAYELGASLITFSKIHPGEENKDLVPDNNLLFVETMKLLRYEKEILPINLRLFSLPEIATNSVLMQVYGGNKPKIRNFICHRNEKMHIRKDGEVYLCLYASTKDVCSLGNIKNNSLSEILENMLENPLFQERIIENSKCNNCNLQFYCKAGCPANAYLKNGTINTFDFICEK